MQFLSCNVTLPVVTYNKHRDHTVRQMVSYKRLKTMEIFISPDVVAAIYERRSFMRGSNYNI